MPPSYTPRLVPGALNVNAHRALPRAVSTGTRTSSGPQVSLRVLGPRIRDGGRNEGNACLDGVTTPFFHYFTWCLESEALAAGELVELRERWLNPPEWVEWVDEPAPGYPKRPVPRDEAAAKALKKRTLTNLYNARPQWLADAHDTLTPPSHLPTDGPPRSLLTKRYVSCWNSTRPAEESVPLSGRATLRPMAG